DMPKEILDNNGISEKILRLSVGIENISDLIRDLESAFGTDKQKESD
ncbi:MAG: PLP-dependent transferase, partial [Butyrivibrio sp.]|nr:PLP-dependent transferase [Butyrivibrio sp.]